MHYRKFYEKCTGKEVPKDFEVHHIDHDRSNNSIDNLVAIPKKLHHDYHKSYSQYKLAFSDFNPDNYKPEASGGQYLSFIADILADHSSVNLSICCWINFRVYLTSSGYPVIDNYKY
jgi:hypothetical protein